ncbi:MAG: hypothetical protein A2X32_07895 [Elusimicrobia bacterium GWC2_64_44]|nr:MAG: hypothetical protein A2X32_07895 [Elusimicrobia bacterium GWC2_64_44]
MKLSEVKKRNRILGIIGAALLFQAGGLDPWLRSVGGTAFSFAVLIVLFVLAPLLIEFLERKFTK